MMMLLRRLSTATTSANNNVKKGKAAVVFYPSKRSTGHDWFFRHQVRQEETAMRIAAEEARPALPPPLRAGVVRRRVFLELATAEKSLGKLSFELADDLLPRTADNFIRLATEAAEQQQIRSSGKGYRGSMIHRIMRDVAIMGGDVDGRGGHSALGSRYFADEGYPVQHRKRGILSMTSSGRDTNNSQFFITLKSCPHFDGQHVAFGALVDGEATLKRIAEVFTVKQTPVTPIFIKDCGELKS